MNTPDTRETTDHIDRVRYHLDLVIRNLAKRGALHDASKLVAPEAALFAAVSGKLHGLIYGSVEYQQQLPAALAHHYAHNTHHPEHWDSQIQQGPDAGEWAGYGVARMSLLDQLEMLADWRAAGERYAGGSMLRSFQVNRDRFKIAPHQFYQLAKTALELGWLTTPEFIELIPHNAVPGGDDTSLDDDDVVPLVPIGAANEGDPGRVMPCAEQLRRWVAGDSVHNGLTRDTGECCPDFSCCSPGLKWAPAKRLAFAQAGESERFYMLHDSLLNCTTDLGDVEPKV